MTAAGKAATLLVGESYNHFEMLETLATPYGLLGRAVLALQQQSDAGNSHFLDNLASVAMEHEARIVLDLVPAIFDRPGRVVQLLSGEDEQTPALVNAPSPYGAPIASHCSQVNFTSSSLDLRLCR